MTLGLPNERGFVDKDHDGINDIFCDKNGDGINDIDNQKYQHNFQFEDKNEDKVNDLFVDTDGDGVNDLAKSFIDNDGDGWNDNVIDHDKNWINDITGLVYDLRHFHGQRYGKILEEIGITVKNYVDVDNDGSFDNRGQYRRRMDRFIDRNGDGVFDGRGFRKHQERMNRKREKNK